MAPPRKTGLNTVTRKRADGTVERHYYDRRTKRYLGTDREKALADAIDQPSTLPPRSTFSGLCASYFGSTQFAAMSAKAKKTNRFWVERLLDRFQSLPAASITRPVVVRLREAEKQRPWVATHMLSKLRLVLQHGVDTGVLQVNPALKPGGVRPPSRHEIWDHESAARMLAAAPVDIRAAFALLLYTAQRPSDVLAMTWGQVTERQGRVWLTLRQQKTGELVDVPAHRDLAEILKATPRRALLVVPSPTGLPWAYRNFSRSWDKVARAVVDAGLQRRDLRRTAMVRMAEAGATPPQIAAVSGHTIDQTTRILDTYIPRRGEVAAGAIDAWERSPGSRVVVLHNVQQPISNDVQQAKTRKQRNR